MVESRPCYSIDTSALIDWWEDYSPDVFPGLLPLMENLIIKGRLRAVRHVRDEIKDSDDELTLAKWCKAQNDFYLDDSGAIQIKVREIMNEFQNPKKTRGISNADQFVISQAVINGDKWCVVSSERPANGDAHKKPEHSLCM